MLESIVLIEQFVHGFDLARFRDDLKTRSAVERQLQIIAEAAYRLGDEAELLCPGLDWRGLRGMGNLLRHGYHKVDEGIVWETVQQDLPELRRGVASALAAMPNDAEDDPAHG
jgi:uncharacterized protein with HEPN domain